MNISRRARSAADGLEIRDRKDEFRILSIPPTVLIFPNHHTARQKYLRPPCPIFLAQEPILELGDVCLTTDSYGDRG